jgi:hypothetical protein
MAYSKAKLRSNGDGKELNYVGVKVEINSKNIELISQVSLQLWKTR